MKDGGEIIFSWDFQEIENNFTVSSGDVRTDIEALKWETTRMALSK